MEKRSKDGSLRSSGQCLSLSCTRLASHSASSDLWLPDKEVCFAVRKPRLWKYLNLYQAQLYPLVMGRPSAFQSYTEKVYYIFHLRALQYLSGGPMSSLYSNHVNCLSHPLDSTLYKPLITPVPFFWTRSLSKSLFQRHLLRTGHEWSWQVHGKLSWQVFAVNIPSVLKKLVHPLVCTEICKVFRSIIKANDKWSGESPKDSFPRTGRRFGALQSHL